jgi:hypothetical protein
MRFFFKRIPGGWWKFIVGLKIKGYYTGFGLGTDALSEQEIIDLVH